MRVASLACVVLLASTAAFAQPPSGTRTLSGNEIRRVLIGNTISGVDDGESYSERLNPDGTISGKSGSDSYSGRWRITGNQICFWYEEDKSANEWDCSTARLRGNSITWDDNVTAVLGASAPVGPESRGNGPVASGGIPVGYVVMPSRCARPPGLFVWPENSHCCCP